MYDGNIGDGRSSSATLHDLIHFLAYNPLSARTITWQGLATSPVPEMSASSLEAYLGHVPTSASALGAKHTESILQSTTRSSMFRQRLCSGNRIEELIDYELTSFGKYGNELLHPINAYLFKRNRATPLLRSHPSHGYEYLLGNNERSKRIHLICAPQSFCRDLTVPFVFFHELAPCHATIDFL